ncbi:MAG: CDP-glycerol glycerophosphotransferase family protein [Lachnospiraceae bacterium]|nr:CDP-glycerol glycerophosphotransferase family protein [Lachnospiraceae bacterium]
MKKLLRKIKSKGKKALNAIKVFKPANYGRARYFWYRDHLKLEEKSILLESAQGKWPADNIAALLKEFATNPAYQEYMLWLSVGKEAEEGRAEYLKVQNLDKRVKLVVIDTAKYYKVLATAKYLITEDSFIYIYTKRQGQVLLNTWNETPLACLGKEKKLDCALLGNEQKGFYDADYLLCSNEFTKQCFLEDYMLANFAKTKFLLGGYPRNEVFFKDVLRRQIREKFGLEQKQVIAYAPAWRKNTPEAGKKVRSEEFMAYLSEWDASLTESQIVYVKQYHTNRLSLDFSGFRHIHPFPENCGMYEFLAAADILVTDYSGVMFDYALTGRKIVLFVPDKEYFEQTRGIHFSLDELPFPQVSTVRDLVAEIGSQKNYDDSELREKYCAYEKENMAELLCRRFIFNERTEKIPEQEVPYNGKKNVLIYMGGFEKNGLTTAGVNLLNTLDREKNNYAVIYCFNSVKDRQESVNVLPDKVARIGFYHFRALTFAEQIPYMMWRGVRNIPYSFVANVMEKLSVRGAARLMGGCRVDTVVQFTGYNDEMIGIMEHMPCNRVIYVHNDMEQEIKHRANANKGLLSHAYHAYDHVAVVTEDVMPPAQRIAECNKEKDIKEAHITWCKNVLDHNRIRRMGAETLMFDDSTVINHPEAQLREVLDGKKKIFVSVGRFSIEKGHERLIKAFESLHKEQPDTALLIIGGHGNLWNATVKQAEESSCPEDIYLVRFMSNPFPLLKQCDYFVLSSLYEGFGLVLVEADVLGVPCFSTDIVGPRRFMKKYGGLLVEDSEQGILAGMRLCMEGKIPEKLDIDYDQYNREAIAQFESVI